MPPVVLLGAAAHHIYYALRHHPCYKAITDLSEHLAAACFHRIRIFESDGAYSNDRLYAHLLQKNKRDDLSYLMIHMRCQSHQTQLINMSLMSCVGHNILNRLYGMTVYLRNLGYWMRIKQAVFSWVDSSLDFRPCKLDNSFDQQSCHPVLLELIAFLKANRRRDLDAYESNFQKKADKFLEMFNGNSAMDRPCHICSHDSLPEGSRHCSSRSVAVRKCVEALLDLLLSSMPSIPAPNKWTTLYGPLDP